MTDRRGKAEGQFDAQDYRIELEHGVTNRFSIAGYANFAGHHIRNSDERVDRDFALRGLSAEFKYQLLSPYKDGLGLTLYAEPAWSRIHGGGEKGTELELEFKALIQEDAQVGCSVYVNVLSEWTVPEIVKAARVNQAFQQVLDDPAAAAALEQPVLKPLLDQAARLRFRSTARFPAASWQHPRPQFILVALWLPRPSSVFDPARTPSPALTSS